VVGLSIKKYRVFVASFGGKIVPFARGTPPSKGFILFSSKHLKGLFFLVSLLVMTTPYSWAFCCFLALFSSRFSFSVFWGFFFSSRLG